MSMMNKIRIVVATIIVIFSIIVIAIIINVKNSINNLNEETEEIEMLNMDDDFDKILSLVTHPNNDWSNLPLSKKFRKKYSKKYGILKGDGFTDLYLTKTGTNKDEHMVVFTIFHDLKEELYYIHYTVNDQNELNDVEIVDKKLLYDENGEEVIYKVVMDENNYTENIAHLAYPRGDFDYRRAINFTKNFESKYIGGFINNRDFEVFGCSPINKLCNFQDKLVYLKCEYPKFDENDKDNIIGIDDELTLFYKVKYTTNDKLWLDDVEVEEVSKEEIDKLLSEVKSEQQ